MEGRAVLAARNLRKSFRHSRPGAAGAGEELVVLAGLELEVAEGEMGAVVGESGVGKSTLLYLLGGLDRPTGGDVFYRGQPLSSLSPSQLASFRNHTVGFVWQLSNLLPDFTARENVALPRLLRGESQARALAEADRWLAEVDLGERAGHLAGELSGGEQQRVALARALVTGPRVLLADEPTGNLDESTSEKIFSLLERLHRMHGLTSVLATHNLALAERSDCVWRLEGGQLHTVARSPS